jgi:bifunctional DNA-binding transcriptional regulator/antitoxin component of YhaV-PrlF toxin-antitoxin module
VYAAVNMNALIATGRVKDLKSERKKKPVNDVIQINPRGSLVIPKALVDTLGLKPGATFSIKKSAAGLSLGKVKPPPKTTPLKKKMAPKKPAAKKAAPKKVPPKKPAASKPSAKKRVSRKTAPKKPVVKKVAAKKAPGKKTVCKKAPAKQKKS